MRETEDALDMYNETRRAAWVEVDLAAIRENYRAIKALSPEKKIIGCVKADAYGHGIVKVSWELVKERIDYLGVATLPEAVALRSAGIRTPIILLSPTPRGNVKDILDLAIIPLVTSFTDASLLSETADWAYPDRRPEILLAADTGMGRLGFLNRPEDLSEIARIAALPNLEIMGALSHFAASESPDPYYSNAQLLKMEEFLGKLGDYGVSAPMKTMANSAAIVNYPDAHFDAVRPGIVLYGLYPGEQVSREALPLTPAMSVKANIAFLKKVPAGFSVSYGMTFTTQRESLIATLPLGYADGLPRVLSNKGRVIVGGCYAPLIGTICMDQCLIDVTDVPGVAEYDEVTLMGSAGGLTISADEIAALCGTISYETVCRFGQRLPKVYK
ncbi:MAG: alanine racemase [Clostridiales Family XIII bacterium]|nr:alanine racemase [Clostridiales Family XIII bacterium]